MKLVWSTPDIDQFTESELDDLLKHLSLNGFYGIEPIYSSRPNFDLKIFRQILEKNEQKVVGLRTGGITLKHGVWFSHPDKSVRDLAVQHFLGSIQFTKDIGAPLLLVGLMQGKLLPSQSYQEARINIVECLIRCGEEAASHQITLGLEAINRFTLGYHRKAEEVIGVLKEINLPNVRLLLDTYHMHIEETCMEETLVASAEWITHIHLADDNHLAPGRGGINFQRIVETLKAIHYEGFISVESEDTDWYQAITESSRLLLPLIS